MKIFVDTSAFLALFIEKDFHHEIALKKNREYKQQGALLVMSDYIYDELLTRIIYDFGKAQTEKAIKVIDETLAAQDLKLLRVDEIVFNKAREILLKFAEHKISFTDATSYVFCKEFKIDEVFSLDEDFKKMGLSVSP